MGVKSLIMTNGAMSKEPLARSIEQGARSEEHGAKVISGHLRHPSYPVNPGKYFLYIPLSLVRMESHFVIANPPI